MRIGIYGMPTAGKSFLMEKIDFLDVLTGSKLLREYNPEFDRLDREGQKKARRALAESCRKRDGFIMDGHYAFGDEVVFTEEDGELYDCFLYIYINPDALRKRMGESDKNQKYMNYDITGWQRMEIEELREYCHAHDKDFYVLDCSPKNEFIDAREAVQFLQDILAGYSNVRFAREISDAILRESGSDTIFLLDGDKTFIYEDSSSLVFNYMTDIFDGNFYTGFQSWKQYREFGSYKIVIPEKIPVCRNPKVPELKDADAYIISSGNREIWERIASGFGMTAFAGNAMSADTKYFIVKYLRKGGKRVIGYGDSMSDYYMLKESDEGNLVLKDNGRISRSLDNKDLGGLNLV